MSKINIQGTIDNIRSKSNVYTPLIEAIVNSIEAIEESKNENGVINIIIKRDNTLKFDDSIPPVIGFEVQDNGIGFTKNHRDSFDTFYSAEKKSMGGKGFGRFMFIKYFGDVSVKSVYNEDSTFYERSFSFGREYDIIINEKSVVTTKSQSQTTVFLNNIVDDKFTDKGLDTIAKKIIEKILTFFVNDDYPCPTIILQESSDGNRIVLNDYIKQRKEIQLIKSSDILINVPSNGHDERFSVKTFKIYFTGNLKSKISLTAHNREVTESPLHCYIPEFEDDFYDEIEKGKGFVRKNYIIKSYVIGKYLDKSVSLEREAFNFGKDAPDEFFPLSQSIIEREVAKHVKTIFGSEVKSRSEKKQKRILKYVNESAPWHKTYIDDLDLTDFPFQIQDERIEMELQKVKFKQEITTRSEVQEILSGDLDVYEEKFERVISKITDLGKSDLAHYVSNRKVVLELFNELLKRRADGKAELEKDLHHIIFPMGHDSTDTNYEKHNLWLLDERLVFSDYIASDKKISKKTAPTEPDLVIFDQKKSFRRGDNEFSNPVTIFEFKRPKRESYGQDDDPILQVGRYLEEIRSGKYETPEGVEEIKVNDSTPVYCFIVADIKDKIREFAKNHSLTLSADGEGYFGFHNGYKMYIEIISYMKLVKDATLRNKIFFKKLHLE